MGVIVRMAVFAALVAVALISPRRADAQAACEAGAALMPALAAAPVVGRLGEAVGGVFDRIDTQMDQAVAATTDGDSESGEGDQPAPAPTPAPAAQRPSGEANLPAPAPSGC